MRVLSALDLSSNKLSGDIPPLLAKLKLSSLNLSSNQLDGQILAGLAIAAYDRSFLDNPGLCHAGLGPGYLTGVRSCAAGSQAASSSRGVSPTLRTGLLVAAAALLALIVAFAFFVLRDIRKRKRAAQDGGWKITPFQTDLGFGEAAILRALTEENLVGSGGSGRVYRAAYTNRYNGKAGAVAVKQILRTGKVDERLERECRRPASSAASGTRTSSGSCAASSAPTPPTSSSCTTTWTTAASTGGSTGTLSSTAPGTRCRPTRVVWTGPRGSVSPSAPRRGCATCTTGAPSPSFTGTSRPSNILLDSEFRAKVADFGLARMLVQAGTPDTVSAVAGSFGYMAPGKD